MENLVRPQHTGNMENATELRQNCDGIATDFQRIFHQSFVSDIPSEFRRFHEFSIESMESRQNQAFHFSMFPVCQGQTDFFILDVLGVIDSRKKFDRKSSSEVRKMLGCLKCKYENCIFICRRLTMSFRRCTEGYRIWRPKTLHGSPQGFCPLQRAKKVYQLGIV